MIEDRDLLERALRQFPPEPGVVERVMRRRDRRRRNQRIAAGLLAVIVAVAALGGLFAAFHHVGRQRPAGTGITIENVSSLSPSWSGPTHNVRGSRTPEPVVHDGIVFGLSDSLYAFPTSCGAAGSTCEPLWRSAQRLELAWSWPPAFDGDTLFISAASGGVIPNEPTTPSQGNYRPGELFAYDTACGSRDATCSPVWSATIDDYIRGGPVVAGDTVFVASTTGRVYAFDVGCGSAGSTCEPAWTTDLGKPSFSGIPLTASGDTIYAMSGGRLFALPSTCPSPSCAPIWSSERVAVDTGAHSFVGPASRPVVEGGTVYVTIDGRPDGRPGVTLAAFPESCSTGCAPAWTWSGPFGLSGASSQPVVETGDRLVLVAEDGTLLAFPSDCAGACRPLWTARGLAEGPTLPVVGDGHVFVSGLHGLLAFTVDCAVDGSVCRPDWVGPAAAAPAFTPDGLPAGVCREHPCPPRAGIPSVGGGVVFSAPVNGHEIFAFATACGSGDATCEPIWSGSTRGLIRSPLVISENEVIVGTGDGRINAFSLPRHREPGRIGWLWVGLGVVAVVWLIAAAARKRRSVGRLTA